MTKSNASIAATTLVNRRWAKTSKSERRKHAQKMGIASGVARRKKVELT